MGNKRLSSGGTKRGAFPRIRGLDDADFIEDYGVDTIYVLGGSAAVADSVLEDLEALANEPTVTRVEGADRYATAAAVAAKLGGGAAWCGGEDPAAMLGERRRRFAGRGHDGRPRSLTACSCRCC